MYKIIFCDNNNISTKFGEWYQEFKTYEDAEHYLTSKNYGWGNAIINHCDNGYQINSAWLKIVKIK